MPQAPAFAGAAVSMFASFNPLVTTVFQRRAITKPKAAANDVEMVFRTSPIENFFSSAIFQPRAGIDEGFLSPFPTRIHRNQDWSRAPAFVFETTWMPSIRLVGYCPRASFSSDFTMSQIVRRATVAP